MRKTHKITKRLFKIERVFMTLKLLMKDIKIKKYMISIAQTRN